MQYLGAISKMTDDICSFPRQTIQYHGNPSLCPINPSNAEEAEVERFYSDINHSRILYDPPPRILEIKAKINKWVLIKLKSFCTSKETISKVKRQPSEWEKIIPNEATDKQLISKIYKQLLQLNSRKINDPIKIWAKELNRHFSKEDIQDRKSVV